MTAEQREETPPTRRSPESDDFPTGPAVSEWLPGFTLPDQHGRLVDFERERTGRRALVVFHRSLRW